MHTVPILANLQLTGEVSGERFDVEPLYGRGISGPSPRLSTPRCIE
ncbi:MAG: hypothetical protein IPH38_15800 [Candidatus Microthrix sp.]|nr:hypothetical protein [Candidatus Microthrix sp.]